MKKLLIIITICLSFSQIKGQISVIDAAHIKVMLYSWSEQISSMSAKLEFMQESEDYLKQSINFYKKIDGSIKNSVLVFKILESQVNLLQMAYDSMTLDSNLIGSEKIYAKYRGLILEIIEKNNLNSKITADFLKEGVFKMNDAERLAAAEQIEKRTQELYSQLYTAKNHFEATNRRALAIKKLED